MSNEVWKDIKGLENKYQISNHGRVKSLARRIGNGKGYGKPEQIRVPAFDSDGYYIVSLASANRSRITKAVHKLVAFHFIKEYISGIGLEVCHLDGNKLNNREDNLYIGNHNTNVLDRYKQKRTKLTLIDIAHVRSCNESSDILASRYGVRPNYITRVRSGERGKAINYNTESILL